MHLIRMCVPFFVSKKQAFVYFCGSDFFKNDKTSAGRGKLMSEWYFDCIPNFLFPSNSFQRCNSVRFSKITARPPLKLFGYFPFNSFQSPVCNLSNFFE